VFLPYELRQVAAVKASDLPFEQSANSVEIGARMRVDAFSSLDQPREDITN